MALVADTLLLFSSAEKKIFSRSLKNLLGFSPGNISLYALAFQHRAAAHGESGINCNNERLEYLGDAILGAVVAEYLFRKFPFREEGFLTEMRSKIVSRDHLNRLALRIGIDQLVASAPDKTLSKSVYGDAFEALLGAIYLDKGYRKVTGFLVNRIIRVHIDIDVLENTETNFKSKLIEWAQKEKKSVTFENAGEIENGRSKLLRVMVLVDGVEVTSALDFSKKKAEQLAAEQAYRILTDGKTA